MEGLSANKNPDYGPDCDSRVFLWCRIRPGYRHRHSALRNVDVTWQMSLSSDREAAVSLRLVRRLASILTKTGGGGGR